MNQRLFPFLFIILLSANLVLAQKTFFKSVPGSYWVSTDLHIHTVFSDGAVGQVFGLKEQRGEDLDLFQWKET